MMLHPRRRPQQVTLPSEKGFFKLAEQPDLPLRDALVRFRTLVSSDMDWTDVRKARFRQRASLIKVIMLLLTASSTVVLGVSGIPARASIALPMVALVTVLSTLESFFNWRSRWILMEEAQYRLNRLRDEVDYYLVTTSSTEIKKSDFDRFFADQQAIWSDVSRQWLEFRRVESVPLTPSSEQIQ